MFEVEVIENLPAYRPRPTSLTGYHCFSNGRFDVFAHEERVIRRVAAEAREHETTEIVGRLIGRPFRDTKGVYTVVTTAIMSRHFIGSAATVSTSTGDAAETSRALEQEHPTGDLVGWYHSHNCDYDDLSPPDRRNQLEWRRPWHVALLAVVRKGEVRVHAFRGPESERLGPSCRIAGPNEAQAPRVGSSTRFAAQSRSPRSAVLPACCAKGVTTVWLALFAWSAVFLVGVWLVTHSTRQSGSSAVVGCIEGWRASEQKVKETSGKIHRMASQLQHQSEQIKQLQQELKVLREDEQKRGTILDTILNWMCHFGKHVGGWAGFFLAATRHKAARGFEAIASACPETCLAAAHTGILGST